MNVPPLDDLGGLEDLAQEVEDLVDEESLVNEVQIIANDDIILKEPMKKDLIMNDVNVEVFIPMENGQPLLWQDDEIQEQELLDHDPELDEPEAIEPVQAEPQVEEENPVGEDDLFNQNMQIGFVQLVQPEADPVFTARVGIKLLPPVSRSLKFGATSSQLC